MIKQMINPDLYHGRLPWNIFEGWYYKIADQSHHTFAFIPGIVHGKSGREDHSFIQVLVGQSVVYSYNRFPKSSFKARHNPFEISIDNNLFSLSHLNIDIHNQSTQLYANLKLSNIRKWRDKHRSHRSMGYYNFIPFMQCYSQVCVMDTDVSGIIQMQGKKIIIENGKGYIEKNWGKAFPYSWIWIQCNYFSKTATAISASIGHIPFLLGSFRGFLIGLTVDGSFYEFTTMNKSKMIIRQLDKDIRLTAENKHYVLDLYTRTQPDRFMLLYGPKNGQMVPFVKETLTAKVDVKLMDKRTNAVILNDSGHNTGVEYGGEYMHILDS